MRVVAKLDGTLVDPEAPLLRPDDYSVQRGDGVFETIFVVNRRTREFGPHLARLARSAALLGMPPVDVPAWERVSQVVIDAWPWDTHPEMGLKLIYTRGPEYGDGTPTGFAMGIPIPDSTIRYRREGVAALTLDRGYSTDLTERAPWLLLGAKTLSYAVNMAATRYAQSQGAQEVIFTASDGTVLEGPTSTVVVAKDRTLTTTPPPLGILEGTTQAALFRAAEAAGWKTEVEPMTVEDLATADGLWCVSSVRLITRVHTLNGTPLPDFTPLHQEISGLYEAVYA
ncbi:aminodeoxychorismate lyase [Allokutzneria albata]|uniref:4-amino-4-deoxychorismate lyase n=1 Tax=Allokutzneria albata TaxID=211114 RepID=A0A1G9ZEZ9_ALLAB|nr:aminodeoxychorismate lyase [Allokutzneria albata]SDN19013.1 4-amino-4-deoxychorismate lyase [Allokutzneria albata]